MPDQRQASEELLSALETSDNGEGVAGIREVVLPLTSEPGSGVIGINALVQDWTTSTAQGAVAVRGVARAVSTQSFDGSAEVHVIQLSFECPRAIEESAWIKALEELRVDVPAQPEAAGQWPTS
ncbi:hypothetical protein [Cellulosimicrobium cellulans]|uniref:hypothetical protein n=1 Tax=Cellulosimicrobium cellulans TaxID=1710 RepID=UPI0024076812|nr:hypothetical protein [Cellulosimicrobium cellulans]MDF9877154.1 hypothetical protein [Cellulosimicrobium cellulans]